MTISSTTNRVSYTGNGVTTAFSFPYKFLVNADLIVYEDGVVQVITTDYTITGAGDDAGGTVTFVVAPANGLEIVIVRDPAITQGLDLVENDSLPAESVEDAFDKLTMIAQRLDDRIDRSFVLSDAAIAAADLTIPVPVADEVLKWNAAGDALESALIADMGGVTLPVPIAMGGTGSTSATNACVALGIPAKHQSQTYTAFSSAGSSPNLTVTTSPAYGSLVANQRMRIAFHVGSSGADTLNRDATGSASLKQYDSTGTKIDAVFAAGQLADVEYDGTDYVILNPLSLSIAEVEVAGVVTGSMSDYIGSTAPDGYVLASGRTIGNAASGGTERANADTSALFALLWNSMANSEASVSSGRGASAAADFAANKTIALPDLRGRSTAGKDNMGGTTASRLTSGGSGITGTTLGTAGGVETHTLTAGESGLPSHGHSISATYITGGGAALLGSGGGSEGLGTPSIGSAGPTSASSAHQNTQPTYIVNKIIKL